MNNYFRMLWNGRRPMLLAWLYFFVLGMAGNSPHGVVYIALFSLGVTFVFQNIAFAMVKLGYKP